LQTGQAPRRYWIQATSTRGLRACIRRVAGCATSTGFAAHAGATASLKLTFEVDHPAGANQLAPVVRGATSSRAMGKSTRALPLTQGKSEDISMIYDHFGREVSV